MAQSDSSKQSRLWVFCHGAKPKTMTGSMRQYDHAEFLQEHGWWTRIISSSFNARTGKRIHPVSARHWRHDQVEEGVDFTWVYTVPYSGNNWRRYLNMLSYLVTSQIRARGDDKPDLVLGSSPHPFAALGGWLTSRRYKTPFILEVRDLWPESLTQLGLTNPLIIKPLELLEKFLYKQADVIVALTDGIADSIKSRIPNPEIVHVLPNAVRRPSRVLEEDRQQTRKDMGWKDNEVVAIYAGAHGPANDLGQIVEAARELQGEENIRFVLIGGGPAKESVKAKAEGLSNITFLDPVAKQEIERILPAADIGLMTLRQIPLFDGARPNKLFDYMGAGLAAVSTIQGEAAKVLEEAGAGVTAVPATLAENIRKLASDPELRSNLANSGFEYACNVDTRETVAARLAVIMDELVG